MEAREQAQLTSALARLDKLVDWERRDRSAGMRQGLEPIESLLSSLGHPQNQYRSVHVAGSKGKGSTAAWIAAHLDAIGARVGVYSSPHVERFSERVVIDGAHASDRALAAALEKALDARRDGDAVAEHCTWFDVVTAAAFDLFAAETVDWAVVEVGLGGRLDSTNVLTPSLCVITNIELEHTAVLGATRAAIAYEKAGIIKPGVPLVSAVDPDDEAGRVIEARAAEVGAPLTRVRLEAGQSIDARNRQLAAAAFRVLCETHDLQSPHSSREEVSRPVLPGRLERFDVDGIPFVLDGAHVAASLELVLDELRREPGLRAAPVIVLGLGRDKDAAGMLKTAARDADSLICTSKDTGAPSFTAGELAEKARALDLEHETAPDPRSAVQRALELAAGRWVLVTGSLHLIGAVRPLLRALTSQRPC